jgi:hypothetical protein
MDWYYPVLTGVIVGDEGRARLAARDSAFVMEGRGVRCVADRPWVTVAETCEYALANLAIGAVDRARELYGWSQQFRHEDARYWTGTVYPDEGRFPANERSTYTAAAVVLTGDAVAGDAGSPASALFTHHDRVLPPLFDADEPVSDRD